MYYAFAEGITLPNMDFVPTANVVYVQQHEGKAYKVTLYDQNVFASFKTYDKAIEFGLMVAGYYQTYVVALGKYQYFPPMQDETWEEYDYA